MLKVYNAYGYADSRPAVALLGFTGELMDTVLAGYMLGMGNRLFSPSLMRFASTDYLSPFGKGGINAYAYCAGDPVNFVDFSGQTRQRPSAFKVSTFSPRKAPGLAIRVEEAPPDYAWALARTKGDDLGAPTPPPYSRSPLSGQLTRTIRLDGHDITSPISPEEFKAQAKALSIQEGTISLMIKGGAKNDDYHSFGKEIVAATLVESHIALARVALHHRQHNTATLSLTIRNRS